MTDPVGFHTKAQEHLLNAQVRAPETSIYQTKSRTLNQKTAALVFMEQAQKEKNKPFYKKELVLRRGRHRWILLVVGGLISVIAILPRLGSRSQSVPPFSNSRGQ